MLSPDPTFSPGGPFLPFLPSGPGDPSSPLAPGGPRGPGRPISPYNNYWLLKYIISNSCLLMFANYCVTILYVHVIHDMYGNAALLRVL